MAKRKKTKAELKEERRRAMEAKRQETGWEPPEPDLQPPLVVDDARARFPSFGSEATPEEVGEYLHAIVDSDWMAGEPEFEAVYFPPIEFANAYIEIAEAADLDPDSFAALDDDERAETHLECLLGTIEEMLTLSLEDDILEAIEALRERLLEQGERERAAEVSRILEFMEQPESDGTWPDIGLVGALGQRSLNAGFALVAAAHDAGDAPLVGDDFDLPSELHAVLEQYPGLAEHMMIASDRAWEDGLENLFVGDLLLDIFDRDELQLQLDAWKRALEYDDAGEEEEVSVRLLEINRYVVELLTPDRLQRVRTHLEEQLDGESFDRSDEPFVAMIASALAGDEALDQVRDALISAFFGELRLLLEEIEGGEGGEDEDDWEEDE